MWRKSKRGVPTVLGLTILAATFCGCRSTMTDDAINATIEAEVQRQLASETTIAAIAEGLSTVETLSVTRLSVLDESGREVAVLDGSGENGTVLTVFDIAGKTAISLVVDGSNRQLLVSNEHGREVAQLGTIDGSTGNAAIRNADGIPTWWTGTNERGRPAMVLYSGAGRSNMVLMYDTADQPSLTLLDGAEDAGFYVMFIEDQDAFCTLNVNSLGDLVALLGVGNDAGVLLLRDKNGGIAFAAP